MIAIALMLVQWGLLSPAFAYLASAIFGLVLGGSLVSIGLKRLQATSVAPTLAIEQVKKDIAVAKDLVR
jgi:hypothetical protein